MTREDARAALRRLAGLGVEVRFNVDGTLRLVDPFDRLDIKAIQELRRLEPALIDLILSEATPLAPAQRNGRRGTHTNRD